VNESLSNEQIEERFLVRGRMEILHILNDLIHRYEPVTINYNDGADSFVTRLLEARDQVLIFEPDEDGAVSLARLKSADCFFLAHPDGIRVQFSGSQVRRISWGGSNALSMPLPQCIARLQRQESLRIQIPASAGLVVQLFDDRGVSLGAWPLHDLSVGGLGVNVADQLHLKTANSLARARLHLPELGTVDCAVVLRHTSDFNRGEPNLSYRIGVGFCDLPVAMRAMIQRYIITSGHARRNLMTEEAANNDGI
jgi:flagellar brake protein